MFKVFIFLSFIVLSVSAKVSIEIIEDIDKFKINLINKGAVDIPIAGYRVHAPDTSWDSISSDLDISVSNYKAGDDLYMMGIYSSSIHQLNFKNSTESVMSPGDTITVIYYDSNIESIPEVFNNPFDEDIILSSLILRGYKDGANTQLTVFNNMDIFPPTISIYVPVYYNRNRGSSLVGGTFDTSGIMNIAIFNDSNWIYDYEQEIYFQDDENLEFSIGFDHDLKYNDPGWIISFDSCGNGTLLELRSDVSFIESFTYNNSSKSRFTLNGRMINLDQLNFESDIKIEMRDMKGRMVYSKNVSMGTKSIQIPVDSRCMSSGLYFVTFKGKNYTKTFKLNINR